MIYRGDTFMMRPTPEQSMLLEQHAGVCRLIWNLALDQRLNHHRQYKRQTGESLSYVTQGRELTLLRADYDFIREVSQTAQERVLRDLDQAFNNAFRGKARFPVYKKKGARDAFSIAGRYVAIRRINKRWGSIKLAKLGWVKVRMPRDIRGKIIEAAIRRTISGWQVSLSHKTEGEIADIGGAVGIDRGIAVPLMLSDGGSYHLPKSLRVTDKRVRAAQHSAARGHRGSARNTKAMRRVAMLRRKVTRIRQHWAHEATTAITRQYGTVVVERLRTKAMSKSAGGSAVEPGKGVAQKRGLNRAILNVGWSQVGYMLAYKAFRLVQVDPRHTSQTCSACGTIDKGSRKNQARFICTGCGHHDNADRNAAVNILNRGNALVVEGGSSQPKKREPAIASAVAIRA